MLYIYKLKFSFFHTFLLYRAASVLPIGEKAKIVQVCHVVQWPSRSGSVILLRIRNPNKYQDPQSECWSGSVIQIRNRNCNLNTELARYWDHGSYDTTLNWFCSAYSYCNLISQIFNCVPIKNSCYRDKISMYVKRHLRADKNTQLTSTQELVRIHTTCGY